MKWEKPKLIKIGHKVSNGKQGCCGGYDVYFDSCSKGYKDETSCSVGAGRNSLILLQNE